MAPFAIVATFEVVPGRMDEFLPLLLAHRDRCLKDEPGTVRFDVLRPRNDEHQVMTSAVPTRSRTRRRTRWDPGSRRT